MAARICWMLRAFWLARPPQRMAPATCPAGAAATCSQLENLSLSCANARSELVSDVCCDKTVATTSSMTGSTGLGVNAPCSARSRRCTSLMQPLPGAVMGGWYPGAGGLRRVEPRPRGAGVPVSEAPAGKAGGRCRPLPFVNRGVNGRCTPGDCSPPQPWLIVEKSGRGAVCRSRATCDDLGRITMTTVTLVLGGTGKTGRRLVQRLTALDQPVRIGSRSGGLPFDWEDPATWAP